MHIYVVALRLYSTDAVRYQRELHTQTDAQPHAIMCYHASDVVYA